MSDAPNYNAFRSNSLEREINKAVETKEIEKLHFLHLLKVLTETRMINKPLWNLITGLNGHEREILRKILRLRMLKYHYINKEIFNFTEIHPELME